MDYVMTEPTEDVAIYSLGDFAEREADDESQKNSTMVSNVMKMNHEDTDTRSGADQASPILMTVLVNNEN